jgi:hypothetical protein
MADMEVTRGTRMSWIITMDDPGYGLNFTNAAIYFAVRDRVAAATVTDDTDALIACSTETAGISVTGEFSFVLETTEADTKSLIPEIYMAGFKWVPDGETDARSLGEEYTFEIKNDPVRAI